VVFKYDFPPFFVVVSLHSRGRCGRVSHAVRNHTARGFILVSLQSSYLHWTPREGVNPSSH
jgi:hypothetical protein